MLFAALVVARRGMLFADSVRTYVDLFAAASAEFGLARLVATLGAWARRSWNWLLVSSSSRSRCSRVAAAIVSGGWHPALLVAIAPAAGGLLAPATRRALDVQVSVTRVPRKGAPA